MTIEADLLAALAHARTEGRVPRRINVSAETFAQLEPLLRERCTYPTTTPPGVVGALAGIPIFISRIMQGASFAILEFDDEPPPIWPGWER